MSRYYFFDLDGTLLGPSRRLHPKTAAVLKKLQEQGDRLFLCSGRSPAFLRLILPEIRWDGYVGCAGGSIVLGEESLFENDIRPQLRSLLPLFRQAQVLWSYETREATWESTARREFMQSNSFLPFKDPRHIARIQQERELPCWRTLEEFDFEHTPVPKVSFVAADPAAYERIRPMVEKRFHVVYFQKRETFFSGELIDRTCTKADGIRRIVAHFGGRMEDTVAFGDSMNDYQMLGSAGLGVVFEGACEELRALTPNTFKNPDEGGIGEAIERLGLV